MQRSMSLKSGEVELAVYAWGETAGRPTVVLVHGYPDCAEVWTAVAERLAARFHVVAYDVRGAGQSSAPRGTAGYALKHLVEDLAAVVDAVSPDQPVHLVGHDWGALQGWEALVSTRLRGRIASYSAATPALDHVGLWVQRRLRRPTARSLREVISQALGSSYMMAFQLPLLPELSWRLLFGRHWPALLARLEGVQAEASDTRTADGRNGLGLYRANLLPRLLRPQPRRTEVPVQLLVMRRDRFVPARVYEGIEDWVPNLTRTEIDAGHWAPLSHPQAFADAVTAFVMSTEGA